MKKIFLFFVFNTIILTAQTSLSCYYREYCQWDDKAKTFGSCEGYEEASLFVLNKNETMFTHTIESLKSTYYINEKEFDGEKNLWIYSVTSDVGNKYIYVFDPKNKEIRALIDKDGKSVLLRFYVKAIF